MYYTYRILLQYTKHTHKIHSTKKAQRSYIQSGYTSLVTTGIIPRQTDARTPDSTLYVQKFTFLLKFYVRFFQNEEMRIMRSIKFGH